MQDLRVIGIENGAMLVSADDGTRFRIPIDEALQSRLRHSAPDSGVGRKLAPKEIQAHIRSGMSAHDVASITGAALEYIQRFEGPVIAEREFVIESALKVIVHTAADTDPMRQGKTFGKAISGRLHELGGTGERWASWKDADNGWVVKLSFTAGQVEHDARWQFDPKKQALAPLNSEAITLSQQGDSSAGLVPRLRAVAPTEPAWESARFDSGAFVLDDVLTPTHELPEPVSIGRARAEPDAGAHGDQTTDLLEALRRRRGEREAASSDGAGDFGDVRSGHGATAATRIVEIELPEYRDIDVPEPPRPAVAQPVSRSRKGRVAMPSWDDIVFGARPDDDLA
jgi:hypothetical protein